MNSVRWFAFQYVTTTESMYNSRIREKSSIKHFKKGANGGGETPRCCPDLGRPTAGVQGPPQGRDSSPSAFMQFP